MTAAIRERVRSKIAEKKSAPSPSEATVPVKPPDQVVYLCGHRCSNRLCASCRAASNAKKAAARQAKREADANAHHSANNSHRLPDDTEFFVTYCAATQSWSGELRIGDSTFDGQASGVFQLLRHLDTAYRASLPPNKIGVETGARVDEVNHGG